MLKPIVTIKVLGLIMALFVRGAPIGEDAVIEEIFHAEVQVGGVAPMRANDLVAEALAHQLERTTEQPRIVCGDKYAFIQGVIDVNEPESVYDGVDCHVNPPWIAPRDVLGLGR